MINKKMEETIFEEVSKCVEEIRALPFDKGLPVFQSAVWKIGDKFNIKGDEVVKIYFDNLQNKK